MYPDIPSIVIPVAPRTSLDHTAACTATYRLLDQRRNSDPWDDLMPTELETSLSSPIAVSRSFWSTAWSQAARNSSQFRLRTLETEVSCRLDIGGPPPRAPSGPSKPNFDDRDQQRDPIDAMQNSCLILSFQPRPWRQRNEAIAPATASRHVRQQQRPGLHCLHGAPTFSVSNRP
ncbi:hypothetical protein M011DRAFT_313225 [Sporormia fimetaria CBS 119925]|uniref:Uncharacterized protein n=1 Tax=Sporormia fimetaria CBS 119925 TaxID=1340428 RepID=A0A6A6VGA5_9PLEO|nr:hypothetical protein M011DRAFT_313225 [Sporormia fimetaria CBS 119925]